MNAVELLLPGGKPSGVFMCGQCHRIESYNGVPARFPNPEVSWKDDEKVTSQHAEWMRERAEGCCRPTLCNRCMKPSGRQYVMICGGCAVIQEHEREVEKFTAAVKLTVEQWGASDAAEMLYDSLCDKWFRDLDDAEEWYADDEERTRPAYLWCSKVISWKPDASGDIGDRMHDLFNEDACNDITQAEWDKLDAMVTKWWEEQGVVGYDPDFSRCVLLSPTALAPG